MGTRGSRMIQGAAAGRESHRARHVANRRLLRPVASHRGGRALPTACASTRPAFPVTASGRYPWSASKRTPKTARADARANSASLAVSTNGRDSTTRCVRRIRSSKSARSTNSSTPTPSSRTGTTWAGRITGRRRARPGPPQSRGSGPFLVRTPALPAALRAQRAGGLAARYGRGDGAARPSADPPLERFPRTSIRPAGLKRFDDSGICTRRAGTVRQT